MTTDEFKADCIRYIERVVAIPLAQVDALVEEFLAMPGNSTGGLLHVVLDDSNIDDESILACREAARAANDEAAFWLAQLLDSLLPEDRALLAFVCPCCTDGATA